MSGESLEQTAGVGAFIVIPQNSELVFLTIEESRSKRLTNKLQGMRSLPMETVEKGENHREALGRLFKEEVKLGGFSSTNIEDGLKKKLCRCELASGIALYAYLFEVDPEIQTVVGSEATEVTNLGWTTFQEVLEAPIGSFRFRAGVYEVMQSYLHYQRGPQEFQPETYTNPRDRVPSEVFDLLDQGVSQNEALYRLGLVQPPLSVPLSSSR